MPPKCWGECFARCLKKCTSVINQRLWQPPGPRNIFSPTPHPKKITFLSWHWQIGLIDFVKSYCDHSALGEVPDFCAINHVTDDSDIHTCSTAGSLVAQFLVPFPVNRQKKVSHCIVCLCAWARYSLQVKPSALRSRESIWEMRHEKTWLHWSWKTWSDGLWSVFKMNKCSRTSGCWCGDQGPDTLQEFECDK